MSSDDCYEPDFWSITASHPAIQALVLPDRRRSFRPRQPTLLGVPKKARPTSLWRMVERWEAELMNARRST